MLTPIDVHYLVGLLTLTTGPDGAEVELGSMVLDQTTSTERDVDVTVLARDDEGRQSGFGGIEVKAHGRPLDVAQIEQLCAKLTDMPSLSSRAVVSASGYTGPATKKAAAHQIDLLELAPLRPEHFSGFSVHWEPAMPFDELALGWCDKPDVQFLPRRSLQPGEREALLSGALMGPDGSPHAAPSLEHLSTNVVNELLDKLAGELVVTSLAPGQALPIKQSVRIHPAPSVRVGGNLVAIDEALVRGAVKWTHRAIPLTYRGLFRVGEHVPIVGCGFAELSVGHLVGVVLRPEGASPLISIPLSDRNRQKIYRQALRSGHAHPRVTP